MATIDADQNPIRIPVGGLPRSTTIRWSTQTNQSSRLWRSTTKDATGKFINHTVRGGLARSGTDTSPNMGAGQEAHYILAPRITDPVQADLLLQAVQNVVAHITPKENPIILKPSETPRATQIDWSTGDGTPGWVTHRVDSGSPARFDPPGVDLAPEGRNVPTPPIVRKSRHVFELFVSTATGSRKLAEATITAMWEKEQVTVVGSNAPGDAGLVQEIRDLVITPGADTAEFSFRTTQPTVPVVFVDHGAGSLRPYFRPFDGRITLHRILAQGLPQERTLKFTIKAESSDPSRALAELSGEFTTGSRLVEVVFVKARAFITDEDAEPRERLWGHAGTMEFYLGVYDGYTEEYLGPDWKANPAAVRVPGQKVNSGQIFDIPRTFSIPNCPNRLILWACGVNDHTEEQTTLLGGPPFRYIGGYFPQKDYKSYTPRHGSDQVDQWTVADQVVALRDGRPGQPMLRGFGFESGDWPIRFSVWGYLSTTVEAPPPTRIANRIRPSSNRRTFHSGDVLPVQGVQPGPGGGGRGLFFSLSPGGAVLLKSVEAGRPNDGAALANDWQIIGEGVRGPLCVVPGKDRTHLIAAGAEGTVLYQSVRLGAECSHRGEWEILGRGMRGPLAAAGSSNGSLDVFALGLRGNVLHKAWDGHSWKPRRDGWRDLGGKFDEPLAVESMSGGDVALFAFTTRGIMHRKFRTGGKWEPSITGWEVVKQSELEALAPTPISAPLPVAETPSRRRAKGVRSSRRRPKTKIPRDQQEF